MKFDIFYLSLFYLSLSLCRFDSESHVDSLVNNNFFGKITQDFALYVAEPTLFAL